MVNAVGGRREEKRVEVVVVGGLNNVIHQFLISYFEFTKCELK